MVSAVQVSKKNVIHFLSFLQKSKNVSQFFSILIYESLD